MDVTDQVYFGRETIKYKAADVPHLVMCRTAPAALQGEVVQRACSEMLHWDEYREALGLQDGTGKMLDSFLTRVAAPFLGYTFKGEKDKSKCKAYSVAVNPAFRELPLQTFCSEMEHWDAYRERNNIRDNVDSMRELFCPKAFGGNEMIILDARGKLLFMKLMCIVNSRESFGRPTQMLCTEMIHWDEFQEANGILLNPTMKVVFGKC
ncbi:hypothetical protein TraAM80_02584 [Trypanosoma rangeli]|uniref:Uncharacterized protein n=1 Tax=Trypanosoma rangeli TaxID=5698 RepID=A0A3R7KLB2_TRYRA|nr:uncharacterized protein TraAM80_02584 [Trypanosoma rangeli]RNF08741.1 hypothetical protein TraAM80_02584 [Trypanosoma rangeli]|eukprot:RNF08741.1 hypothetical protein TraAM80_02584 [Trypanosoma rangeli]